MDLTLKKHLSPDWKKFLGPEFNKEYMLNLQAFLKSEIDANKVIFPKMPQIFSALNSTPPHKIKVVILGQDPYHGEGQAHGMAFSVRRDIKIPPSLANIYKELKTDQGIEIPKNGYLESWATEGVLLLNTVLSVERSSAGSHKKKGWEPFTDKIIQTINDVSEHVVFILWGAPAGKKASMINESKHLILKAPHPSPLSSYRGFFGCQHFSKTNKYLLSKNIDPINWEITS